MKLWDCLASHHRAFVKEGGSFSLGEGCLSLYLLSYLNGNWRAGIVKY